MLFKEDAASCLADGTMTLTYRTWTKPQAKTGGRYRTWGLLLEVDAVRLVDPRDITDSEARRAGAASAEALRHSLDKQGHNGHVWRIEFRCLGADDRIARRSGVLDNEEFVKLEARLTQMDQTNSNGAWTKKTLRLIESRPGVVSTVLAQHLKMERMAFKTNVRKLKELGLTESLDVGYQLSALGTAFLRALKSR